VNALNQLCGMYVGPVHKKDKRVPKLLSALNRIALYVF